MITTAESIVNKETISKTRHIPKIVKYETIIYYSAIIDNEQVVQSFL